MSSATQTCMRLIFLSPPLSPLGERGRHRDGITVPAADASPWWGPGQTPSWWGCKIGVGILQSRGCQQNWPPIAEQTSPVHHPHGLQWSLMGKMGRNASSRCSKSNAQLRIPNPLVLVEVFTGTSAALLLEEGGITFPSLLMSLKFLLWKIRPARLCAWEMDFVPQETYLSFCSEVGTK